VVVGAIHDFVLGPRALDAIDRDPDAPRTQRLRRIVGTIGRVNGTATLVIVLLGVTLVRGCP
jgi:hypothetical protein